MPNDLHLPMLTANTEYMNGLKKYFLYKSNTFKPTSKNARTARVLLREHTETLSKQRAHKTRCYESKTRATRQACGQPSAWVSIIGAPLPVTAQSGRFLLPFRLSRDPTKPSARGLPWRPLVVPAIPLAQPAPSRIHQGFRRAKRVSLSRLLAPRLPCNPSEYRTRLPVPALRPPPEE